MASAYGTQWPLHLCTRLCCCCWRLCRAALELFAANDSSFTANQLASSSSWSSDQIKLWGKLNTQIHQDVEVRMQGTLRRAAADDDNSRLVCMD